ncbi:MAG: hypothetical protein UZ08_BCD001000146 [Candidatus Parvibacillus calidus]|nr:MAG: hypothetical protein UZ08_BCD001000146 [Candidatus Parvibacillus calidus]
MYRSMYQLSQAKVMKKKCNSCVYSIFSNIIFLASLDETDTEQE